MYDSDDKTGNIPVYNSNYAIRGAYHTRRAAMEAAERFAGDGATCRIYRDGNAVIAVYSGPRGKYAACDGARVVWTEMGAS